MKPMARIAGTLILEVVADIAARGTFLTYFLDRDAPDANFAA